MRASHTRYASLRITGASLLASLLCLQACAQVTRTTPGTATSSTVNGMFGVGSSYINQRSAADLGRWVPSMVKIGVTSTRTINASWHEIETSRGVWNWTEFDREVAYLQASGVRFGVMLWGNPGWNTADPRGSLPVNNLAGWERYVTEVSRRLRGKAQWLEVWNEPPNGTGADQRARHYADLVRASYRAAKAVDPAFQIGLAAKSTHVNYLEQVIREGARDHFDHITLHPYEALDAVLRTPVGDRVFMNIVPSVRRMLATVNPARRDVPVLFTELGIDARKGLPLQAQGLVKAYTMGLAQGVTSIQWFEGADGDSGPMGLMRTAAEPRPAYTAMATMVRTLGQTPRYVGRLPLAKGVIGYAFIGSQGPVVVAWGPVGLAGQRVAVPANVTVLDPSTGRATVTAQPTIGAEPVIVQNVPAAWMSQAAQYPRGTWLPDEDLSQARAVSVEFDATVTNRGLYTLSERDVAASVSGYGGNQRAGTVPYGNLFVIEPSFLSAGPEPLEITVTVRRGPSNRNAGFNLVYESLTHTGFRNASAGWFTVPEGSGWHSYTWKVDDASIVNQWGYGFALVSDCANCNDYLIRSVVVRKSSRP